MEDSWDIQKSIDIQKCYDILIESVESNNIDVDIKSEHFPIEYYMMMIHLGERNIERMISYFERNFLNNKDTIRDLQHYHNVDVHFEMYSMIKKEYLKDYGIDIKAQKRERMIDDIID
tara:strand:- start:18061 stop:18414 length:354 start_codon:yes stop_codon:yes gene_type:complete